MRPPASLVALALALVVAGAATAGTPQPAKPAGITWGSVHFTDAAKLSAWLSRRGVRYQDWARRHPAGLYLLTHRAARPRAAAPTQHVATRVTDSAAATTRRLTAIGVAFLSLAGVLLLLSAAGGELVRLAHAPIEPARVTTVRLGAAGGAVAVAIGTALAWWH